MESYVTRVWRVQYLVWIENLAIKNCEAVELLIVSQHSTLATLAMASVYFAQNPNDSAAVKCNQGTIIYFGTIINITSYKS